MARENRKTIRVAMSDSLHSSESECGAASGAANSVERELQRSVYEYENEAEWRKVVLESSQR